jgi:hypothetical protein
MGAGVLASRPERGLLEAAHVSRLELFSDTKKLAALKNATQMHLWPDKLMYTLVYLVLEQIPPNWAKD